MGDKDTPQPAPQAPALPKDLPDGLRKFLSCETKEVTLKDGELTWLTVKGKDIIPADMAGMVPDSILNGEVHPSMTITPDPSNPAKADIKIGLDVPPFGTVGPSIPASITDGQLTADTTGLPQALKDPIDSALKNLNEWFKSQGYKWGPISFGKGTTKLTKVELQPPGNAKEPPPPPPPPPPGPKAKPVPPPTPPPVTPPPVSGGCLGILFLGLATVGIGAILFFGGPALGLFGAQPSASQTATVTTSATATTVVTTTTTTTTPAPQVAMSADGLVKVTVPFGSVAPGTTLTVTPQGQADAPPELAGVTFRSAYYRVGPAGTTLTGPIQYERIIDLTAQGIDPEQQGYPLIQLASRSDDGKWSWLGHQTKLVGGIDGMGPEDRPTQTGTLEAVGQVFGFGGTIYLHRDPYPEEGSTFGVGQPIRIGARITDSRGQVLPNDLRPTIANVLPAPRELPTGLAYSSQRLIDNLTQQSAEITATCAQPGDYVVGLQLDITPEGSSELLDTLGLGTAPTSTVAWTTSIHCTETPPVGAFQPQIVSGCVSVNHVATEIAGVTYPSNTGWVISFAPDPGFPSDATFDLAYREGLNGRLLHFPDNPIDSNRRAEFKTGITSYGDKYFESGIVSWVSAGTRYDRPVKPEDWKAVIGSVWGVTSREGNLAGNACQ